MPRARDAVRLAALAAALSTACPPRPRTQVDFELVAADELTLGRLQRVRLVVASTRLGRLLLDRAVDARDGAARQLLYRHGFFPEEPASPDALDAVVVYVIRRDDGRDEALTQRAVVPFEEGRTATVRMAVTAACVGVACGPQETCNGRGVCESVFRGPDGAPRGDAGATMRDGGVSPPPDAGDGPDAPDAGADVDVVVADAAVDDVVDGASDLGCDGCDVLRDDPENCGAPGRVCEAASACVDGGCVADAVAATGVALSTAGGCARMSDGSLRCWGAVGCDDRLQFAAGRDPTRAHRLLGASGATEVATSRAGTCWVVAGATRCCGGLRSLEGLRGVVSVRFGDAFGCALTGTSVTCAGSNVVGQCGGGTRDLEVGATRVALPDDAGVESIATGFNNACALVGGDAWCWGQDTGGQLGRDLRVTPCAARLERGCASPLRATDFAVRAVAIGGSPDTVAGACAIVGTSSVRCWGSGPALGAGATASTTFAPLAPRDFGERLRAIVRGHRHACVLTESQAVYCWGDNGAGQLGASAPVGAVVTLAQAVRFVNGAVTDLAAEGDRTCVVQAGAVLCAGDNADGGLAVGASEPFVPSPTRLRW